MNKYLKKTLVSLMAIVTIFSTFFSNSNVNAASTTPGSVEIISTRTVRYIYGSMSGGSIGAEIKQTKEGGYVYCIEPHKGSLGKEVLTLEEELTDPGYLYLAKNGFPNKTVISEYGDDENYYATQVAHWMYAYVVYGYQNSDKVAGHLITRTGTQLHNFNGGSNPEYKQTKLADAAYELYKGAKEAHDKGTTQVDYSVSISKVDENLKAQEGYIISDAVTVKVSGASTYKVSVNNNKAVVVDENGKEKTTFKANEKFRIKVQGFDNIDVTATVTIEGSTEKVYRYKPESANKQDTLYSVVVTTPVVKTAKVAFKYVNDNKVEISKVDATNSEELPGAHLVIRDANKEIVDEWTSTKETHKVKLNPGTYTLEETIAPSGYILSTSKVTFTVKEDGSCDKVVMKNDRIPEVEISKVDITNNKEIAGAHLVIKDNAKKVVKEWTSTGKTQKFTLMPGTYTLSETIAPDGYIKTTKEITFTLKANGKLTKVTLENTPIPEVEISKVDATNNEELPGAHLVIKNADKEIVDEWTSTEKTHKVKLMPGTYTLTETIAPNGYILSKETITFTVKEDGTADKVVMKNDRIPEVEVSKVDITNNKELPGAHLVIKNADKEIVDEWTSSNKTHKVKLMPGTYTLTETIAPDGFILSEETITFTLKANGKLTKVTMKNVPIGETVISKVDATNNEELPGAHLVIKDSTGKVVDEWTSTEIAHTVKLAPGTYTLTETIAPDGFVLSKETITFTIDKNGVGSKVTMKNSPIPETEFSKVDGTTGKELPGAHLEIRDEKGNLIDSWVSTEEIHKVKLLPGTYTLTETIAPDEYILSTETVTFTVKADGTVTKVEMKNMPVRVTEIEISKVDITNKKELPGATLELRDSEGNLVDSWVSTNETHKVKLHDGIYTLSETIAPEGYELSTETITFEISENSVVSKIIMENKPYIDVPETGINASSIVLALGSLITLSGFGMLFVQIKKETI